MRSLKVVVLCSLVMLFSACTCKTRSSSIGDADNVPVAGDGGPLTDIHFAFDKSDLSPASRQTLQENAGWLKENGAATVTVEGHCDERGTDEYNLALGQRRAQAAYDYLRGLGIAADRMGTVSYGEAQPLDPRSTEDAWAKNRRAHFRVN
ncbi:MAG: peptidoglycan-associated lipoprotein Pal [Bdellovibrionales bacterium]|nr:peptidoglycan-associated lipoprotein Pal [Bdellovibrionales bacterium]